MSWWGKTVGGAIGLMLGGPLGALLGVTLGHQFDHGLKGILSDGNSNADNMEKVQAAFFTATFSVMGHLAKADGHVSSDEIKMAERVMAQMRLNAGQRQAAIRLFNEGKLDQFMLDEALLQLRQVAHRRTNLLQMFLEIQVYAAFADGLLHPREKDMLQHIFRMLGFSQLDYEGITGRVQAEMHVGGQRQSQGRTFSSISNEDAHAVLGIDHDADDKAVKKAYRRI